MSNNVRKQKPLPKKVCCYKTVSNERYHAQKWAVSSTYLKEMFISSPQLAQYRLAVPLEETAALRFGTAAHHLVLMGTRSFRLKYVSKADAPHPDKTFRDSENKAWRDSLAEQGIVMLDEQEMSDVYGARDAIKAHDEAAYRLGECRLREQSFFWQDEATGVWCRVRPDAYQLNTCGVTSVIDLKTCRDVGSFEREIFTRGYDLQAAFYLRGLKAVLGDDAPTDAVFIAVEKTPPYTVGVFKLYSDTLEVADSVISELLEREKTYRDAGYYPSGFESVRYPLPPVWEKSKREAYLPDPQTDNDDMTVDYWVKDGEFTWDE